jgi:hypothetical protein
MTDLNEYLDLAVKALNGPHGEAGVRAIAKLLRQPHTDLVEIGPGMFNDEDAVKIVIALAGRK